MQAIFDDSLKTGNELIDGQHKELIDKINKLVTCCEEGGGKLQKAFSRLSFIEYKGIALQIEDDVLKNRHLIDKGKMLLHHTYTGCDGFLGRCKTGRTSFP